MKNMPITWFFLSCALVGCSAIKDVGSYQSNMQRFPWEKSCQSASGLLNFDTSRPGNYCLERDMADGDIGEKKESLLSKALSGGHRVSGSGAFYVNISHVSVDMRGFGVYSNRHAQGGVWVGRSQVGIDDVVVRNGISFGLIDAFGIGEMFYDIEDAGYLNGGGSYQRKMANKSISFENMVLVGGSGNVMADDADIERSIVLLNRIYVSGVNFLFRDNRFIVKGSGIYYSVVRGEPDDVVYKSSSPFYKQHNQAGISSYDHAVGIYLSCADNAVIDGNVFSSKTGSPGVPAIVLKRSRNVRITNNTFEGFAMPVLMDQYSSIIDASGNIIKPDITAENPASLLYKLKLEPKPAYVPAKAQ